MTRGSVTISAGDTSPASVPRQCVEAGELSLRYSSSSTSMVRQSCFGLAAVVAHAAVSPKTSSAPADCPNAIVLWNTRYQDTALNQLRDTGFDVHDDHVHRPSPLTYVTRPRWTPDEVPGRG